MKVFQLLEMILVISTLFGINFVARKSTLIFLFYDTDFKCELSNKISNSQGSN